VGSADVEMMPKGMFASEKWLFEGMDSQEVILDSFGCEDVEKDTAI